MRIFLLCCVLAALAHVSLAVEPKPGTYILDTIDRGTDVFKIVLTKAKNGDFAVTGDYLLKDGWKISGTLSKKDWKFRGKARKPGGGDEGIPLNGYWYPEGETFTMFFGKSKAFGRVDSADNDDPSFTGVWKSEFQDVTLTQIGHKVTGTYQYKFKTGEVQNGKISGTVEGNVLTFTWSEKSAKRSTVGKGKFELASDGNSFKGSWTYDGPEPLGKGGPWNGKRIK